MMNLTYSSTLGRRTLWMTCILLSCALWGTACSESGDGPDPGSKDPDIDAPDSYGDTCIDDDDVCVDGMECFAYGSETDDRFCSMQCINNDSCPEESACLSLNAAGGLIKLCVPNDLCIDPDGDEYGSGPGCKGPDCDQANNLINPGAPELCDGIDNNCDGLIDNDTVDARETCDTGLSGVCNDGWYVCRDANLVCQPNIQPGERQEICDGLDNDCDGLVDESGDEDTDGQNYVIGIGRPCGNPDDACFAGYQFCNSEKRQLECDGEDPFKPDVLDFCTGRDDNCNGEVDEDANDPNNLLGTPCYDGIGTCRAAATWSCDPDDPEAKPVCPAEERTENKEDEVCDYTDNDCDGVVDNGFKNDDGVYDQIENCGQCGNDCNQRFGGDPAERGLKVECKVTGNQARCDSECLPGHYDLDKVPANGCEFQPDLDAIYVAKEVRDGTQGDDTNNCGTFEAPCRTITHAISRASGDSKPRVRVAEGIFKEAITLSSGISVMGGHSSRNWILDPAANTTTLQGGIAMDNHVTTVRAESITSTTEFSGFTIDARDAQPGGNSYGIYIKDSNSNLTVKDNLVIAGRGGVGTAAGNGPSGQTGAHGADGEDRRNFHKSCSHSSNPPLLKGGDGGANTCGGTDTSGGAAVSITRCPTNTQAQAINSTSTVGAAGANTQGGAGGISSNHTSRADITNGVYACNGTDAGVSSPGRDGGSGSNGSAGSAGSGAGGVSGGHWQGVTGGTGGSGTHGSGGGGAGSSGGAREPNNDAHYGPTGGGGGAGGCGGNGGSGGHFGGASFGIFVSFSGNSSNVPSITDNEITRGLGGRGGTGGAGGAGGSGGAGGEGGEMIATPGNWTRCGQDGQRGGTGGAGGHGGGGGGGVGGASFDIATGGNSNNAVNAYQGANSYTQGSGEATGGQGGAGGTSIGSAGAAGAQGASGNFRRF